MFDFYNQDLRILNFTHIDFDGVVSSIVIKNYFANVIVERINYGKEPDIFTKIAMHRGGYDAIIFTDFCPAECAGVPSKNLIQEIVKSAGVPVLVLDHHESALKHNDPANGVYINTKYCGAMLAWKYFGVKKDLSKLSDLVKLANDYDLFTLVDPRSMPFNALYWQMGFEWFLSRFKNGNTNLYPEEKQFLLEYKIIVQQTYDTLMLSDLPHHGCFYRCGKFMSEMSHRLANDGYQYQIVLHNSTLSVRSATDKINLVDVCQFIGKGGGHRRAVGIALRPNDDLKAEIQRICFGVEHVLNNGAELPF